MLDEILTTAQTAKLLGVSVRTAQLWVESGDIPSWKTPGGHRRIPRAAIVDMLASRQSDRSVSAVAVVLARPENANAWRALSGHGYVVKVLEDPLAAAVVIGESLPDLIVIENDEGGERARLAKKLCEDPLLSSALKVLRTKIGPEDSSAKKSQPLAINIDEPVALAITAILERRTDRPSAAATNLTYPLPANEGDRLKAVEASGLLYSPREPAFDGLIDMAIRIFRAPIAMFTLLTSTEQWFKARAGYDGEMTPREWSFCNYTLAANELTVLNDLPSDPRFKDNPTLFAPHYFRFYAGAPVRDENGFALGSICIIDRVTREFGTEDRNALTALADAAAQTIKSRSQERQLRRLQIKASGGWDVDLARR
ncbi:helix-turn-helix domain-containing protein [Rhizobium leguminosarum bv. viciae]|nr:helix-turn-helix domain-containing protein [Rhizobium leguminosarum bv. viciae]